MKNTALRFALLAALVVGTISLTSNAQSEATKVNPLDGKVVIVNPSSISKPHEKARIESLADKEFLVYEIQNDAGFTYESWMAIDEIDRLRVFKNMDDARAYSDSIKNN